MTRARALALAVCAVAMTLVAAVLAVNAAAYWSNPPPVRQRHPPAQLLVIHAERGGGIRLGNGFVDSHLAR